MFSIPMSRNLMLEINVDNLQKELEDLRRQNRLLQQQQEALLAYLMHESRNTLQRSQAALERLRWRLTDQSELLELLELARAGQEAMVRLSEAARDFARPIQLRTELHDLGEIWHGTGTAVMSANPLRQLQFEERLEGVNLHCEVDRQRMTQAFRYYLENALATCPDPVRILVFAKAIDLKGRPGVQLSCCDNRRELNQEQRQYFFELYSPGGMKKDSLGMAVARKILQTHDGDMYLDEGSASCVICQLPRRRSW
jgi:two-component system, LuxR family, sensor kinase FixL